MRRDDSERLELLENIRALFAATGRRTAPRTERVEALSRALRAHVVGAVREPPFYPKRDFGNVRRYLAIAVGFLIVIIATIWGGGWSSRTTTPAPTTTGHAKIYTTLPGQRAKVDIGDGSSVILAADSRLKLSPDFGKTSRTVELEGQALFTVAHDGGVPFVVTANGINTRVLGTTFSARHYSEDKSVDIVVASGKVEIAGKVLLAGDKAMAASLGNVTVTHDTNVSTAFAWSDGRLVFDRTTLRDAVPELERWYGIRIKVQDTQLLDRRITTVLTTERVQDALKLCADAVNARLAISGINATISQRSGDR